MYKLFKLKKWLTLEDAAKWLTSILEEELTVNDVLQLVIENHIPLSWYANHRLVQEVQHHTIIILSTQDKKQYEDNGELPPPFAKFVAELPDNHSYSFFHQGYFGDKEFKHSGYSHGCNYVGLPFHKAGVYKMNIETGAIRTMITSWLTADDTNWICIDGLIFEGENGKLYQPVDIFPLSEKDKAEGKSSEYEGRTYPTDDYPTQGEMVILRSDLEVFSNEVLSEEQPKSPLRTNEQSITESLGVMAILLADSSNRFSRNNKPNSKQIAEAVNQKCAEMGISIDMTSNLNKDLTTAFKAIQSVVKVETST